MTIPDGATHRDGDRYYKQAGIGAYVWTGASWCYMEDRSWRRALAVAEKLKGGYIRNG